MTNSEKQARWRERNEKVLRFYEEMTGVDRKLVRQFVRVFESLAEEGFDYEEE